jgi:DNA/RNA endonuclease YhcR with UshA esterase domain
MILALALATAPAVADEAPAKPLTPAEAAKKVDEKVSVEFEVKSTGGKNNRYLNSKEDYKDADNFTVFIPKEALDKFKEAKIDDPAAYYKGKIVRVAGTVVRYDDKPQIRVEDPALITVMDKK